MERDHPNFITGDYNIGKTDMVAHKHKSIFQEVAKELGDLVTDKNKKYGDSFGKTREFLQLLWPDGIPPEAFTDALTVVRVFDKLMRIATDKYAYDEDAWRDIAGYAILAVSYEQQRKKSHK